MPRGSVALASAAGVAAAVVDVASGAVVWLPPRLPLWSPGRGQKCRGAMVTGSSAMSGVVEFTGAAVAGQGARVTEASMAKEMGWQLCRCLFSCGCGCSCILEARVLCATFPGLSGTASLAGGHQPCLALALPPLFPVPIFRCADVWNSLVCPGVLDRGTFVEL